ncbi:MAG: DnaA N-terminal domain-containing protein, partial [Nitrospiraceae bacterium]
MQGESVWNQTLAFIQGKVPKQVFDTWFVPVRLQGIEDSTARIEVPNKFFGEWLGQHYGNLLAEALAAVRGEGKVGVAFVTSQKPQGREAPPQAPPIRGSQPRRERRMVNLNPKYTFTSFVVGASNQFAHAA